MATSAVSGRSAPVVAVVVDHDTREGAWATVHTALATGHRVVALALCPCPTCRALLAPADRPEVVTPADLGLDDATIRSVAATADRAGLRRWALGHLLAHLARRGGDVVALRAGIEVLAPLARLVPGAEPGIAVLGPSLPHTGLSEATTDTDADTDTDTDTDTDADTDADTDVVALAGTSPRARAVVEHWLDALGDWRRADDAAAELARAAGALPTTTMLGPESELHGAGEGLRRLDGVWQLDGEDVVLLDLSRTSSRSPWVFDAVSPRPAILLSREPDLAALVAERLAARSASLARPDPASAVAAPVGAVAPVGATTADGTPFGPVLRTAFRSAERHGGRAEVARVVSDTSGTLLRGWLLEAAPHDGPSRPATAPVSRYLAAVRDSRPDLVAAFPHVPGADSPGLVRWATEYGTSEEGLDPTLLATPARSVGPGAIPGRRTARARTRLAAARTRLAAARTRLAAGRVTLAARRRAPTAGPLRRAARRSSGVNLVGYLSGELGIGQSARQVRSALEAARVPVATETVTLQLASRQTSGAPLHESLVHDTTLLCVNAAQTAAVTAASGDAWRGTRRIGYWYWEIETFPASQRDGFRYVDEVWVATDFVRRAVEAHSPVPVLTLSPPLWRTPTATTLGRDDLGLPDDRPVVLFVFDYLSTAERKNPWGAVEAFRRAVADRPRTPRPLLVLKSINADERPYDAERLRLLVAGDPDVLLLEHYQSAAEMGALMAACDVYLSLHRSEGLGLTIADAMSLGKPVVATAYGGNLQFMDDSTGYLVPWTPTPIPPGCAPYPEGSRWADPDLDAAAALLRTVLDDPESGRAVGARAAEALRTAHDPATAGARMRTRLDEVRRR